MPEIEREEWLDAWLAIATEWLYAPARRRVETEIRSHYAEAVGATMAEGHTEEEAHRSALAALGDPEEAGRRFRKTYLTTSQAKFLAGCVKGLRLRWIGLLILASNCLVWTLVPFSAPHAHWPGAFRRLPIDELLTLATIDIGLFIGLWLCPHLARQHQWRRALILLNVPWALMFYLTIMFPCRADFFQLAFYVFIFLFLGVPSLSAARKLGKHADLCDSFPADKDDLEPSCPQSLFPFLHERVPPWELDRCFGYEREGENDEEQGGRYA